MAVIARVRKDRVSLKQTCMLNASDVAAVLGPELLPVLILFSLISI